VITDADLAQLCALSYKPGAEWDHAWTAEEICVYHRVIEGVDVIVFRGSVTPADWLRDFKGLPEKHRLLGWCHDGFLDYMDLVFEETMAVVGREIIVTGHSLGAARASILAGLYAAHGSAPIARVVFGEPRPAFKQLRSILRDSGMQLRSYRNVRDPITLVPDLFDLYVHPSDLLDIDGGSDASDPLFGQHHIEFYRKGVPAQVIK
jgi:hypothetical protein